MKALNLIIFTALIITGACHSSKTLVEHVVADSERRQTTSTRSDSVVAECGGELSLHYADLTAAEDAGIINIRRDSAGRAVAINWLRRGVTGTRGQVRANHTDSLNIQARTESADSTATTKANVDRRQKQETDAGIKWPIEQIIGSVLLIGCAVYLIIIFIIDNVLPWIRRKLR